MTDVRPPVKRLSRAEQQEQTRTALLDAAIELFIDRGIEATTIEEVSAAAGFSRGAFYSNFASKDDLFIAACRHFFLDVLHTATPDLAAEPAAMGSRTFDSLQGVLNNRASMLIAEACLYTIRHPAVAEAFLEVHRQQLVGGMQFVEAALTAYGINQSPIPTETLANLMQATVFGLHLKELVDPNVHAAEAVGALLALVLKGMTDTTTPASQDIRTRTRKRSSNTPRG